ncbi:hypothetical protein DTL42_17180 [Bremerella cremea]|uniref:Uncharacterized protein n=2 Tax=Bremerella cremea TaxID=1031537 RepID=A0A368KN66_9BACT|nr:hypothetical protein DTL42_17180 [Bremerella cremea]
MVGDEPKLNKETLLEEGNGKEATDKQWRLANRMRRSDPNPLRADFTYMYIDLMFARDALHSKDEEVRKRIGEVAEMFKGVWGGQGPADVDSAEFVYFSDLGEWRFPE